MRERLEPQDAPPPPGPNKVEITVGGHAVSIESSEPLDRVIDYALGIYERTKDAAGRLPFGFDVTNGQFERAEPYVEPSAEQGWEDGHGGGMGRQPAQDGTTQRLVLPDPPGGPRTRLGSVPVGRGRATVPRSRY